MKPHPVAALIGVAVAVAHAGAAAQAIRAPIDNPDERAQLRKLTMCVADVRPQWARTMLSYPYLSDKQAGLAAQMVSGQDHCLNAREVAVAFRTSSVVGFAAEHFLERDMSRIDPRRLSEALNTVTPMNVSEDFALCLAARDPAGALNLASSVPGSGEETRAAGEVASGVAYCSKPQERLDVDVQALRALVATALYRGVTAAVGTKTP